MESKVIFDREKHVYRNAQNAVIPSVTQILAKAGLCDFSFIDEDIRMRSMQRGTSVHWMLQLEDEHGLDGRSVPRGLRPYRKAYLDWKEFSGFTPSMIEVPFISHYGYAGTIDRYGTLPPTPMFRAGSVALVDFKSGEVAEWTKYQLAGYSIHIHKVPAMARTVRRIALALRADGTYRVREFPKAEWDYDWAVFIKAKRSVEKEWKP